MTLYRVAPVAYINVEHREGDDPRATVSDIINTLTAVLQVLDYTVEHVAVFEADDNRLQ